jgi:hypothetical protein
MYLADRRFLFTPLLLLPRSKSDNYLSTFSTCLFSSIQSPSWYFKIRSLWLDNLLCLPIKQYLNIIRMILKKPINKQFLYHLPILVGPFFTCYITSICKLFVCQDMQSLYQKRIINHAWINSDFVLRSFRFTIEFRDLHLFSGANTASNLNVSKAPCPSSYSLLCNSERFQRHLFH